MRLCETFPWTYFTALVYFSRSAESWPQVRLSADPPGSDVLIGQKVTLTCRVTGFEGWKYIWIKETNGGTSQLMGSSGQDGETYILQPVRKTDQGRYQCRAQRGSEHSDSNYISLRVHVRPQAVLSLDTGFLKIMTKGSLTLRCEVEGSSVGWSYSWYADGSQLPEDQDGQTFTVRSGNGSYHREYKCRGNRTEEPFYFTISNGLVPSIIISQAVENVSRIGAGLAVMVLLSIILMREFCGRPRCGGTPRNMEGRRQRYRPNQEVPKYCADI